MNVNDYYCRNYWRNPRPIRPDDIYYRDVRVNGERVTIYHPHITPSGVGGYTQDGDFIIAKPPEKIIKLANRGSPRTRIVVEAVFDIVPSLKCTDLESPEFMEEVTSALIDRGLELGDGVNLARLLCHAAGFFTHVI